MVPLRTALPVAAAILALAGCDIGDPNFRGVQDPAGGPQLTGHAPVPTGTPLGARTAVADPVGVSRAITFFRQTCMAAAPGIDATAEAGRRNGFAVAKSGAGWMGSRDSHTTLQVGLDGTPGYDCAVTVATSGDSGEAGVRQSFFRALGGAAASGTGTVTLRGAPYTVRHTATPLAAGGPYEHSFILEAK